MSLREDHDRQNGNFAFDLSGDVGRNVLLVEGNFLTIVILGQQRRILAGLGLAGVGELRVVVRELAVIEFRRQRDGPFGILWNVDAVVGDVGGAGLDGAHVQHGSRLPGVSLVDRIAFAIELVGAIEVSAGFDCAFAIVLHAAAPVDQLAVGVFALELEPDVERVERPAREEVADFAGAHHDVHSGGGTGLNCRADTIDRRGELADFADYHLSGLLGFLAYRRARHQLRTLARAADHGGLLRLLVDRTDRENVDGNESGFEKLLHLAHLDVIAIGERDRHIGAREAVRVYLSVVVAGIVRSNQRHVAIETVGALWWVIKRARALPGNAAGLPIIVIIETPEPAVVIDRHVEVHLVAGGAKLGGIHAHEGLHERALMRNRIEIGEKVIERANVLVVAGGDFVQRWILDGEAAVAHGAVHVHDGVAGRASEAGVGFGSVDLGLDRPLKPPVEEDRVIVTTRAPFARLRPDDILHVLDRLAIELIIERREMVHRAFPLLEDVLVASAAGLRVHEKVRGDDAVHVGVRRRGEEGRFRTGAFLLHAGGNDQRIANAIGGLRKGALVER